MRQLIGSAPSRRPIHPRLQLILASLRELIFNPVTTKAMEFNSRLRELMR